MRRFALILGVLAGSAGAQEWQKATGEDAHAFLKDQIVDYGSAWQRFYASGRTLYNAGHDSWGTWRVQGDQYCSQWPPSGLWDCYDVMLHSGTDIRFVGSDGSTTDGRRRP
ncbi:hypothetical protein [Shimia abyssi]|uniref:Uncharacterized protein n=1 Tax=Shimia abyssi TaxID=1662395 RepID=A0A2P8FIX7_9RHOB|nr:hypothetical protein [Shimia abyssi]PSL21658.1 hypothetical protein CLV88_10182 [Shimia abyssi]